MTQLLRCLRLLRQLVLLLQLLLLLRVIPGPSQFVQPHRRARIVQPVRFMQQTRQLQEWQSHRRRDIVGDMDESVQLQKGGSHRRCRALIIVVVEHQWSFGMITDGAMVLVRRDNSLEFQWRRLREVKEGDSDDVDELLNGLKAERTVRITARSGEDAEGRGSRTVFSSVVVVVVVVVVGVLAGGGPDGDWSAIIQRLALHQASKGIVRQVVQATGSYQVRSGRQTQQFQQGCQLGRSTGWQQHSVAGDHHSGCCWVLAVG